MLAQGLNIIFSEIVERVVNFTIQFFVSKG